MTIKNQKNTRKARILQRPHPLFLFVGTVNRHHNLGVPTPNKTLIKTFGKGKEMVYPFDQANVDIQI